MPEQSTSQPINQQFAWDQNNQRTDHEHGCTKKKQDSSDDTVADT